MKTSSILFAALILGFSAVAAHADSISLTGSTVHAKLIFPSSPANEFAPNNVDTIGPGKEFLYDNGIATYTANFSANGLIVRVNCDKKAKTCDNDPSFVMTFRDPLFLGATVILDSDTLGVTESIHHKKITIDFGGGSLGGNTSAKFTIVPPVPTPEPSSIVLLGTGLLGLAGTLRRRLRA